MKLDHVDKAIRSSAKQTEPPTDSQLKAIALMKEKLTAKGVDLSFMREAENKELAKYIIRSLIRLCEKHEIRSD